MSFTIITGATSGIGFELSFLYAKEKVDLILVARREVILEKMKCELEAKYHINVVYYTCDLDDITQVKEVFTTIKDHYEIHCLINNAGIGYFESVNDITKDSLTQQMNINLTAPILITKLLLSNLERNKGSVVNVCSALSYLPNMKSSVYTASKFGLYGFSNSLRLDHPNLHVLSVHPITVKTEFFSDPIYISKVKNVLKPEVVAKKIMIAHKKRKRKLNIPSSIGLLNILYQIFPGLIDTLNRKFFSNK